MLTFAKHNFFEFPGSNSGNKDAKVDKVDILSRFFPQTPMKTDSVETIKNEQERFEKENKEKAEENEKSWKRMKLGLEN